jgi:predicted Zn-dependent protease
MRDSGADRFRRATEGLVWGENFVEKELEANRYRDLSLRVRFDFPEGWTYVEDAQKRSVRGAPADAAASLSMQPQPRTLQTPEEFLYNQLNIGQLRDGREIQPARLKGFTGILPGAAGQPDHRIAVVYYKMNAYLFTGEVADASKFTEYDTAFLAAVDSFRPVSSREIAGQKPTKLHYVKATFSTTFAALAQELKLSEYEAEELRLINGYYPKGEPKPGEWIKIFVQ